MPKLSNFNPLMPPPLASIGLIKSTTSGLVEPDAPIFRSFPAAGPVMAPRLLVAFGTDRGRFADSQEVQQLYGIAPVKKESGQSRVIHMRHRAPKFGKQTFHENAGHAQRKEGWTREYYQQQRERKKGHHAAVRSLSFKLIRIYFRCWKNNQPYDQAKYEKALEKHGSPLAAILKSAA
jgi:transposase